MDVMVENLRVAFKQLLNESEWMSSDTKPNAAGKADAIKSFMAFPEWLFNKTVVENQYVGVSPPYVNAISCRFLPSKYLTSFICILKFNSAGHRSQLPGHNHQVVYVVRTSKSQQFD